MTPHRRIPKLPQRPVPFTISGQIHRSYPVGKRSFSRAAKGKVMTLTITTEGMHVDNFCANMITKMNSKDGATWEKFPFVRIDKRTLVCKFKPKHPGLHSFRTEFSNDNGKSWVGDIVQDAWVLVDPPQVDSLRLYTLIPSVSGKILDWKGNLKHIKKMGFNAIHLLPITLQDTSQSPYSAKDLFNIDPSYLDEDSNLDGLQQLDEFVKEAKAQNIKLCFDLVFNHIGIDSVISKQAPDWIVQDSEEKDGFKRAGYWYSEGWGTWKDLVLINYEHPSLAIRSEIWSYMINYTLFWAKYANDTGGFVRIDNLHSSNPDFVMELTTKLHAKYPNVGIIAEYFADENTMLHNGPKWKINLNLATPWDYKFVPKLRDYLIYIHHVSMHIRYFMPITSHDSGTPSQEFGSVDSTNPRYVAAALLGTGATGIVQGVEYGEKKKIDFMGQKIKREFPSEPIFESFLAKVNNILTTYPAFRQGGNCIFVDNGHDAIIAAFRESKEKSKYGFLVVCNFDIYNSQDISINLKTIINTDKSIKYNELLSGDKGAFSNGNLELSLPPSSAKVIKLIRKK